VPKNSRVEDASSAQNASTVDLVERDSFGVILKELQKPSECNATGAEILRCNVALGIAETI
jgi:hypothetical protein